MTEIVFNIILEYDGHRHQTVKLKTCPENVLLAA